MPESSNLTTVPHNIIQAERTRYFGHVGGIVWFTGMSASGKSTLAMGLEARLHALGYACYTLDGDNIRHGLNADLGFSQADRAENIRRVGQVAALFADAGLICITSFISPFRADRLLARASAGRTQFHEIYLAADLATCEARDPKGLYRKARTGALKNFTGIDAPYEPPIAPEVHINTATKSVNECLDLLVKYLLPHHPIQRGS